VPNGQRQLSLYIVEVTPYVCTTVPPEEVCPIGECGILTELKNDIWKIASSSFLAEKPFNIRKRYQDIINESSGRVSPLLILKTNLFSLPLS
jgi:hypothetical protein